MGTKRIQGGLYYDAERRDMTKRDREMIPGKLVVAMAALALSALALASYASITGRAPTGQPQAAETLVSRDIVVASDGVAAKITEPDGSVILNTDNGAFLSVVISGLDRARKVHRISGNPPVTLSRLANGRLTLFDPATDWHVELTSFGAGNTAYWNAVLPN